MLVGSNCFFLAGLRDSIGNMAATSNHLHSEWKYCRLRNDCNLIKTKLSENISSHPGGRGLCEAPEPERVPLRGSKSSHLQNFHQIEPAEPPIETTSTLTGSLLLQHTLVIKQGSQVYNEMVFDLLDVVGAQRIGGRKPLQVPCWF